MSIGVHVLRTGMGSAVHARELWAQITDAKWRIGGWVQVGVLSTTCHCVGGLAERVGEGSGREGCRVPVCTHVQFCQQPRVSSAFCMYAPGILFQYSQLASLGLGEHLSAGGHCLQNSFRAHV